MLDLSKYKCAIFDCDGVILQSNEMKSAAFAQALVHEPEDLVVEFVKYHKENGGISRYVKFDYYFNNIKSEKNNQEKVEKALSLYADIVFKQLKMVDYVPGVIPMVKHLNERGIPCYVVSGGDQQELRDVFAYRRIDHLFVDIFGSPVTKNDHVALLMQSNLVDVPAVFFGDSRSDMVAASDNGIEFCYVSQFSEWKTHRDMVDHPFDAIIYNFEDMRESV